MKVRYDIAQGFDAKKIQCADGFDGSKIFSIEFTFALARTRTHNVDVLEQ